MKHKRINLKEVKDPNYTLGKLIFIADRFIFIYDINIKNLTFSYFWCDQVQMITTGDLKSFFSHLYPEYDTKQHKNVECWVYLDE